MPNTSTSTCATCMSVCAADALRHAPVERVWIEKDDGRQRPIGKPAFEDKIVQRAVAMRLEAIYEQDFLDCS